MTILSEGKLFWQSNMCSTAATGHFISYWRRYLLGIRGDGNTCEIALLNMSHHVCDAAAAPLACLWCRGCVPFKSSRSVVQIWCTGVHTLLKSWSSCTWILLCVSLSFTLTADSRCRWQHRALVDHFSSRALLVVEKLAPSSSFYLKKMQNSHYCI